MEAAPSAFPHQINGNKKPKEPDAEFVYKEPPILVDTSGQVLTPWRTQLFKLVFNVLANPHDKAALEGYAIVIKAALRVTNPTLFEEDINDYYAYFLEIQGDKANVDLDWHRVTMLFVVLREACYRKYRKANGLSGFRDSSPRENKNVKQSSLCPITNAIRKLILEEEEEEQCISRIVMESIVIFSKMEAGSGTGKNHRKELTASELIPCAED